MNLSTLLDGIAPYSTEQSILITGIQDDSRSVCAGDLFIAHGGPPALRPRFIQEAIQQGAVAVLTDADSPGTISNIPCYAIPQLKQHVASIAARFYGYPCQHLKMIGVTGTNGKTSCTLFIARLLALNQIRCGIIGTLGSGFVDALQPDMLTTPGAIELQHCLSTLQKAQATHIAMEVSSHSLVQHRVAEIPFEIAVFTNLTRDHLDYHGTMQAYAQAKRLLFLTPGLKHAVINADDAFGQLLLQEFSSQLDCYAYSLENPSATVFAENIQLHREGFSAHVCSPWGEGALHSPLLGRFNISNMLAALTTLCILGIPFPQVLAQLSQLPPAPGRMQCLGGGNKPLVIIDFSHTPDALEKALQAIRAHIENNTRTSKPAPLNDSDTGTMGIWCVFGCGGDRDKGKRPLMGEIAARYSDHLVVTNDNPRFEDPHKIIEDILAGIPKNRSVTIEPDRRAAIAQALAQAHASDVILIAGKGHEAYQWVGDQKIAYSDIETVQALLDEM